MAVTGFALKSEKHYLRKMEKIVTDNSAAEFLSQKGLSMIDFWAPWCGPCRMLGPVVEQLAKDYEGRLTVGKCNVDDNRGLCESFGISNIPALIFFRDGSPIGSLVGYREYDALKSVVDDLLKTKN